MSETPLAELRKNAFSALVVIIVIMAAAGALHLLGWM